MRDRATEGLRDTGRKKSQEEKEKKEKRKENWEKTLLVDLWSPHAQVYMYLPYNGYLTKEHTHSCKYTRIHTFKQLSFFAEVLKILDFCCHLWWDILESAW